MELDGSTLRMKAVANDHWYIETMQDGKNVRINSRNVTQAAGDHTAVSIKPSKTADGTGSVTGLEVSPRFQSGVGGEHLRAILADPVLKSGAGDITGQIVAFEANFDFDAGTRTITGDISAFSSFLDAPSSGYTYNGDISFLRVRGVNVRGWDYFLNVDDANTGLAVIGATMFKDPNDDEEAGYLKILVGSTYYQIAFWDSS